MTLPCSEDLTAEDFEMSDMMSSVRRSESQVLLSPGSASPAPPSPASQSLTAPAREPAPDDSCVVPTAENALLPRSDSSAHDSNPSEGSHRRTRPHDLYEVSISLWMGEMTSLFISIGLLVAMIVVLSEANNQPEQNWNLPLKLSTLVNTLSTVYRALLTYVAAEIVNQEKWIWLWTTSPLYRPLRHIQYFEAGSRGLLGAFKLMPLVAKRSPASLLALIVIVTSLAVGPFAQQSISTDYRATEVGIASLPVTYTLGSGPGDFYFRTLISGDFITWSLTAKVRSALFSALANPSSNDSIIPVDCPTGNCEFRRWGWQGGLESENDVTHASIGMCRRCHDVSSLLSMNSSTYRYSLPNGMEITTSDFSTWLNIKSDRNVTWAESVIPLEMAAQMRWSFTNTTVLTVGPGAGQEANDSAIYPSTPVAVTCSLYPCLRTYSASIQDGRLVEHELQSHPLYPDLGNYTGTDVESKLFGPSLALSSSETELAAIQSPCRIDDSIVTTENMSTAVGAEPVRILDPNNAPEYPTTMAPKECTFRIKIFSYLILSDVYGEQFLNGNCTWDLRQGYEVECPESWWLSSFWENKTASVQSVEDRFSAIADATTNQFRLGVGREANSTNKVYGTAMKQVAYTVFDWQWFLLPVLLLLIDAFLLGWMLYRSIRYRNEEMPWKGNLLPLLYYRSLFEGDNGEPLEGQAGFGGEKDAKSPLMTAGELEDASKQVFVRLRRGKSHLADEVEEAGDSS